MNIQVQDISKIYGAGESQVTALNHASMTIHSGGFISIIGPSGSGKSTLLHIVSGLDKPTSGSVYYGDTDIHNGSDKQLSAFRRQKIGFIFQDFNLIPSLNVWENIVLPLGLDNRKVKPREVEDILKKIGLQDKKDAMPSALSGGQKQRTAIARALVTRPAIILADEPTGNLDVDTAAGIVKIFKELAHEDKKCVIAVTHSEAFAAEADVVVRLEKKKLQD